MDWDEIPKDSSHSITFMIPIQAPAISCKSDFILSGKYVLSLLNRMGAENITAETDAIKIWHDLLNFHVKEILNIFLGSIQIQKHPENDSQKHDHILETDFCWPD